jgi:hypothetical protein
VIYDNQVDDVHGFKIYTSWSGWLQSGEYEIGVQSYALSEYFPGRFPYTSNKLLRISELQKMTKPNLRIMRNEIFARYGYIFTSGGDMDTHFGQQEWYTPMHHNVDAFLTEIESENLKTYTTGRK